MKIELNGRPHDGIGTVTEAVRVALGAPDGSRDAAGLGRGTAVAVNGEVVPRAEWDRPLLDGDAVEVLTATQGG
ncbi:sulfur carrier protein ThiS [Glycomyces sp. L485]|uniref:sulfur carrier protein ThiS n=1 Tax=Glycomyces sp. L485 TaxID=2909235 RepID=UPI001F4B3330|nr:sulfur carrier protein ThiS [Glycomyces sp. L485]MCH7233079.1 sulfur carrier protein ThiS [Glycomyces sp. L485]